MRVPLASIVLLRSWRTPSGTRITSAHGRMPPFGTCQARILQAELHRLRTVVDFRRSASRLLRHKGEPQVEPDGQHPDRRRLQGRYGAPQITPTRRLLWLYLPQALKST